MCISPVRCGCPGAYFSVGTRHFRTLFLQHNVFLHHFRPFSVTFFSLAHFVTECVLQFFMAQWFPATYFFQKSALSEEHSSTNRGKRQEHLSTKSRLKKFTEQLGNAQESSLPCRWSRRNSGLKLERMIDTTETKPGVFERLALCVKFRSDPSRVPISICLGTRLNCVTCVAL